MKPGETIRPRASNFSSTPPRVLLGKATSATRPSRRRISMGALIFAAESIRWPPLISRLALSRLWLLAVSIQHSALEAIWLVWAWLNSNPDFAAIRDVVYLAVHVAHKRDILIEIGHIHVWHVCALFEYPRNLASNALAFPRAIALSFSFLRVVYQEPLVFLRELRRGVSKLLLGICNSRDPASRNVEPMYSSLNVREEQISKG